jgi:hypothetical protein
VCWLAAIDGLTLFPHARALLPLIDDLEAADETASRPLSRRADRQHGRYSVVKVRSHVLKVVQITFLL